MGYPVYYVVEGDTLPIFFDSFDGGTGASATLSGLAVTDIEIYKDGGTTQRASDAGYTLLDTDGIDFDGITGINGFSIDLSDNTTVGFYEVGPWYHVVVSSVTIDGQTVNFIACAFRIVSATRGLAGTALPPAAADAAGGLVISDAGGFDIDNRAPAAAAVTNLNTVYNTDFATNYDATNDRWTVNVKTWNDLTTVALPLVPTTAGRTLDVSAGGEAGVDWANVGSPTTTVNLSGTSVLLGNGAHGGSSAVITAERIIVASTTTDEPAVKLTGNGTAEGLFSQGGASGHGATFCGGATKGSGALFRAAAATVSLSNGEGDGISTSGTRFAILAAEMSGNIGGNVTGTVGGFTTAAKAELQQEATDALTAYDPPTNAEMEARTLAAASYATPTNITAGTITTVTNLTNAPTAGDLTATMKASVNTEVLDVLNVDTFAQPGQEAPAATTTLGKMLAYLYKAWRNKTTQTSSEYALYADDGTTKDQEAAVTDDGTTYTKGEVGNGA